MLCFVHLKMQMCVNGWENQCYKHQMSNYNLGLQDVKGLHNKKIKKNIHLFYEMAHNL